MKTFIALYRGINVGGNNSVKMESLRALHEKLGHLAVRSYIQSGNIVFSSAKSAATLLPKLSAEFAEEFGFDAKVVIVPADRWSKIIDNNPYSKHAAADPKKVSVGVCEGEADAQGLKTLLAKTGGREAFVIGKGVVYLHAPDGFGTSKFAAGMERAAGVPMTVRNWRTVEAIWDLAKAGEVKRA
ncbi:MAG: hypothetical protein C0483_19705 [Pirellula sp.]|nr:hypothetical protein [Pirellula sp.]